MPAGRAAVRVRVGLQEARFVVSPARSPAVVDVVAEVPVRTRVTRIGDCEIRLRGMAVAVVADDPETGADSGV